MAKQTTERLFDAAELPGNTVIWRYMNFTKFVSMLATHSLWFSRPFKFNDSWEGLHPPCFLRNSKKWARKQTEEPVKFVIGAFEQEFELRRQRHRCGHFVNCWHIGKSESDAIWRLYGLAPEGVASPGCPRRCGKRSRMPFIGSECMPNQRQSPKRILFTGDVVRLVRIEKVQTADSRHVNPPLTKPFVNGRLASDFTACNERQARLE